MKRCLTMICAALAFPFAMAAESITAGDGLQGMLLSAPGPQALILAGAGMDLDGNARPAVHSDAYRLLAEALQAAGIGTARADKRGLGRSASADYRPGLAPLAQDALAWADVLAPERCLWLIGHSEGAVVAMMAARTAPDRICGLVLLMPPGRPLGEVLRDQIPRPLRSQAGPIIDSLARGEVPDTVPFALRAFFTPQAQRHMAEAFTHDPVAIAEGVGVPVLMIFGGRDRIVGRQDYAALRRALPDAAHLSLPDVGHMLKPLPALAPALSLMNPDRPLSPELVEAVAGFILR